MEEIGRPSGEALGTVEMLAIKPPTTVKKMRGKYGGMKKNCYLCSIDGFRNECE